jgi:hypothetical protein
MVAYRPLRKYSLMHSPTVAATRESKIINPSELAKLCTFDMPDEA